MKIPDITIRIKPVAIVPNVEVSAVWNSLDDTPRSIIQVVSVATLDSFIGDLIYEIFDAIKAVEEETDR